ncbi:low molecular weight phosphatase family protein [Microbacterium excoecariae]|uniref:arsenate reductase/protein-tyrosine-phosphatase family protein n=1 Tax=Microbacterium excoecariae TaxID=2715210 RepID=UPI001408B273|nr:low molecular weight phosphatase family protein [Microbacterium excoecariae]NHI17994.1 low molecular weight phosphatase family protein [Microbacterium excoecariae]
MVEILTVCTGNICRSPMAELILGARLAGTGIHVSSAGVRAPVGREMTPDAARLAEESGADPSAASAHRARYLDESVLAGVDLVLAMTREHRRAAVELAPAKLKVAFTAREFARLAETLTDAEVRQEVAGEADPARRLRRALDLVSSARFDVDPPADPSDDDVVDPYQRSRDVYDQALAQLLPGVEQVARVARLALA